MGSSREVRRLEILLVEDESDISGPLRDVLGDEGHEVTVAGDGEKALALLETRAFDLVIADLRLPKVDGLTILARVHQKWPRAQAILMSAYGSVPEARFTDERIRYFPKPFDLDAFLQVIDEIARTPPR